MIEPLFRIYFVGFLGDLKTPKRHFEINSPFCRLKIVRKPPGNSVKQIYVVLFSVTYPQSYNFFQIIILGHILHVSRYVYEPRYLPTNCYIIYSTCLFVYNIGTLRDVKKLFLHMYAITMHISWGTCQYINHHSFLAWFSVSYKT